MIQKMELMALPRTTAEQWAVLAAVIDQGSYAHAAEVLHPSQSAVSYALSWLQESLGRELLQIEGRRAVLTRAGGGYAAEAGAPIAGRFPRARAARGQPEAWLEPEPAAGCGRGVSARSTTFDFW